MHFATVGEIIAKRRLYIIGHDKAAEEIILVLGKPQQFPDSGDYYCPYQITGLGSQKVKYGAGIDAFQAIQLTIEKIAIDLWSLNKELQGRLRWEGDEHGDLGFPPPTKV